jgi:hypothetical protein
MRTIAIAIAALLAAAPLAAQQHDHQHHHAGGEHGRSGIPEGWEARLDRADASMDAVYVGTMGEGYHFRLGPSGIFYDPSNTASGEFTVSATLTQNAPTPRPESYGIFLGGRDLQGAGQDYLYFLVRQDGRFMIRHRAGDEVHTIQDWTEHEAVRTTADGAPGTNTLTVVAGPQRARFLVNDVEVASYRDIPYLNTEGVVGFRVNHNLDVHVEGPRITRGG